MPHFAVLTAAVRSHAGIFARGLCMGAADLVPGVSGGTIAFVSGIYDRLLAALAAFAAPTLWRDAAHFRIAAVWRRADGDFLLALFAGIAVAVAALSGALHHLLETRAHALLGFFFGLVFASVFAVRRQIGALRPGHVWLGVAAAAATFALVTVAPDGAGAGGHAALFFGGMVAIAAMLLPGISGSYILLILGQYPVVIAALHERDFAIIAVFAGGCGAGALLFSRLLSELLRRRKTATVAALIGVMIGALPKLWPWKESAAGAKIILQRNVMPGDYVAAPEIALVVALGALGALGVLALERLAAVAAR